MDQAYPSDEISGHKMISSSESTIIPIPPSTNYCGADSPSATGAPTPVASTFVLTQPSPSSRTTKEKSHIMPADELVGAGPNRGPTSLSHVDAPRCPHLEECMFPRFLSLDCKQIDDFCMGCVGDNPNVKRLGRIYVEALHLQEFLKNPQSIESEKKLPIMNGSGKRLREPNPLPLSKRSSSSPSSQTGRVANEEQFHLSQNYFGGLEGKRTWLHNAIKDIEIREEIFGLLGECTTDEDSKYRKASPSSNELLDNSKAILASFPNDTLLSIRAVQPESLEDTVVSLPVCTLPDCVGSTHQTTEEIQGFDEVPPSADDCKNIDCRGSDTSTIVRSTPQLSNESLLKLDNVEGRDKLSSDKQSVKTDTNTTNRSLRIKSNFERATREGRDAALKANQLLESFRRNRRNYWAGKLRSNGKAPQCLWCPRIDSHSDIQFGMIKDDAASSLSFCANDRSGALRGSIVGDDLVQCLECDLVGCAPTLLSKENSVSHQHAMLHFLMSGHRFGVTCGPLGEVFCMGCGDFVYHECFDQERERVFLEQNIPQLSWRDTPINRGIDPSSFVVTAENKVLWQGIIASYPTPVSAQFVKASKLAAKRFAIFRGELWNDIKYLGPKAMEVFKYQQCHARGQWLPVGIYNLGNTCSMSATLQCLIHCKPLHDLFLRDLAHPYQSCSVLRSGKSSCLTCEMDKTILEYFGSAVGIDTIAALEEHSDFSTGTTTTPVEIVQPNDTCGLPLIPSRLLAECWRNRSMKNVAGHGQHDAQEFFDAFVDCLAHHALAYQKSAQEMRNMVYESRLLSKYESPRSDTDFIKNIFTGTLTSVLVCQQCGCKRTQSESFSNVSLPLAKEFLSSTSQSITRQGKISVDICLDHFTLPETLSDPVFCVVCDEKTITQKQHTFSKLPEVLCLHLKRFNAAANKKITDFVSFPARDLDMGKHLTHWREWRLDVSGKNNEEPCASNPQVLYDLFATVNHRGTLHQGHYTAYVKCGQCWYFCNDAFVTTAGAGDGEKEVLRSEGAYMLFYQKKKIL